MRRPPKSLTPPRAVHGAAGGGWVFYHGTPDERTWEHGGAYGIHVGTEKAAHDALNARIGKPLEGSWDGTREYGKTLLDPGQSTGAERGGEVRYPTGRATYASGHQVPMNARPSVFPVRITGPMIGHPAAPVEDGYANARMKAQITRGNARSGYYYRNVGEDPGSVSAAVPSAAHLERVHPPREAASRETYEHDDPDKVYLRFGRWPANERSHNFATGTDEEGVSAYELSRHGDPMDPDPTGYSRHHFHDEGCEPYCDLDRMNEHYGETSPEGRVTRAERARAYGREDPDDTGHLVKGELVGFGHDAEPLLRHVRRVGDWIDHRHLFLDQAQPHRLARHPSDEDYEEPEEKPPYAYRNRTAALAASPTRESQLAAMDPRTRATALAQEEVRRRHPGLTEPLDAGDGERSELVSGWLRAAGHPRADEAYVVTHPDPGHMQSATGRGPGGEPVVVTHPDRRDKGTAAHETAHLLTDLQTGRGHGEPHGPEGEHGPRWARNYASLLNDVSKGAGGHFISLYRQNAPAQHQEDQARRSAEWRAAHEPQQERFPGMVYLSVPHGTLHALPEGMQRPEGHHLTVAHLPRDMDDDQHAEVLRHAAKAAAASPPLEGTLGGMETFPRGAGPETRRVAFVPARVPGVDRLHSDLAGVNTSPHEDYQPHVTVSYLRKGEQNPGPHPQVPVRFTHLHVERDGQVTSFPLTGAGRAEAATPRLAAYTPASASGYGAARPRRGFGKGREHWSQPPEQRTGRPGEHMYRFQDAEFHDQTMREGIEPRQCAGHLPDDPDKTVYMTSDDHVFHARPEEGHPGTPEWSRAHGNEGYHRHYKIDVSGLPLVEDRTYTNPVTGQKRSWMAIEHIAPERIKPHLPGSDHGVTYDLPGGGTSEWKPMHREAAAEGYVPPQMPPRQLAAHNQPDFMDYRRDILAAAKDPEPGTVVWRSEQRLKGEGPHPASVGIHWTLNPDQVIHMPDTDTHHTVVYQGRVTDPAAQAFPRSHPMWAGRHKSMDSEAEVRLRPGTSVHVEGTWTPGVPSETRQEDGSWDHRGRLVPMHPERMVPGHWHWNPVGAHVPVRHAGQGYADYSDVGLHREAVSGYDGLTGRSGMIYLDLPPGTVRPVPGGVDDHHVTVCYLGKNVSDEAFEEACRRTRAAAARLAPMDGVLRGIDVFPPSKGSDGKVVAFVPAYIGGVGRLRRLLEDLSASEHKDWRPHATLGYLEEGDSLPAPHPAVRLRFTRVHVKRGDEVRSFPLGDADNTGFLDKVAAVTAEDSPGRQFMDLYHRTTERNARKIVQQGFRARSGSTWFSDNPEDSTNGRFGTATVHVRMPADRVWHMGGVSGPDGSMVENHYVAHSHEIGPENIIGWA